MDEPARRWARASAIAAAVLLSLVAVSAIAPAPAPCGALPRGYAPVIAFELARDRTDLHAVFGDPGPCRDAMVAAMDLTNVVDLTLFIPAYALFLVGFARSSAPLRRAGSALAVLAALADVAENVCLLSLTPALDADGPWLARLRFATDTKWLALGALALVIAAVVAPRGRAGKLGAALCCATPIATVGATVDPARFGPFVTGGVTLSWVVALIAVGARARRRPARADTTARAAGRP